MHPALVALPDRLPAGADTERVLRTAEAVLEHIGGGDPQPWLDALVRYAHAIVAVPDHELWSAMDYVAMPLLGPAGQDPAMWAQLLDGAAAMFAVRHDGRLQQHAIRDAAPALAQQPRQLLTVFASARELLQAGIDPGWLVQLVVPALAAASPALPFDERWLDLHRLALAVHQGGMHVGYPLATGLVAVLARPDAALLPQWLPTLQALAITAGGNAYGLFEHALPPLATSGQPSEQFEAALRLALTMYDHGLEPGPTLPHLGDAQAIDIAARLASAGVDPAVAVANGRRCFALIGCLDDDGDRLVALAIELHRRGLRQLLFEDGMDALYEMAQLGLAEPTLQLIEAMVQADIEPGVLMRWHLPRILPYVPAGFGPAALLQFAGDLVAGGVSPEPAVGWAARPLFAMAQDGAEFQRLAAPVVALTRALRAAGVDATDVLFHDVAHLAEAGQESQAFVDLMAGFQRLLAGWTEQHLDPAPLLGKALPAAAAAAAKRPWVLATALAAADRMTRAGRSDEALVLLETGVGTAAIAANDAPEFQRALSAIEERYAALPPELAGHASAAAAALAGADLGRLSDALDQVAAAARRHGDALLPLASALPHLARMAAGGDELGPLIDLLVEVAGLVPDASELAPVAVRCCHSLAEARIGLRGLAAVVAKAPERRRLLHEFTPIAAQVAAPNLGGVFERVHAAHAQVTEKKALLELLQQARDEATLQQMLALLPPLLQSPSQVLLSGLLRAKELLGRNGEAWALLVQPALASGKQHAGMLLSVLRAFPSRHLDRAEDMQVAQRLITQLGVRATDMLGNLVLPALTRGLMPSLEAHEELLARYLRQIGFADAEVYGQFVAIVSDGAPVGERLEQLRERIESLTAAVRAGEVSAEQQAHSLFGVALQRVFPPAVTQTQQGYVELVRRMPDRPDDVRALFPSGHRHTLELRSGAWQLRPEAQGLEVFGWCAQVLPGPDQPKLEAVELGWQLLSAWAEDRLAKPQQKHALCRALLATLPPESLPDAQFDSAGQVLAIHQLAGDRLFGLVEQAIVAARAKDSGRVDRLVRSKLQPPARVGPGLQKAIAATLRAAAAGDIDAATASGRLAAQLAAFELPDDLLAALQRDPSLLQRLPQKQVEIEPGKELQRVHADLVGQELAAMSLAISQGLEYLPNSEPLPIEVELTKRSVHAPVGFTTGVCVATDRELWQQPGFLHLMLFVDGVCQGGVHLLLLTEGEQRFLALPGINPSWALLERVDPGQLVRALLAHCRELAAAMGCAELWVPAQPGIHSNRNVVHEVLAAMAMPVRPTAAHAFSYSPYRYVIDAVLVYGG